LLQIKEIARMVNLLFRWYALSLIALLPGKHPGNDVENKTAHPFYVSVVELNHNAKEKTAEVSIRIFTEDLEATLKKYGNTKVDLLHPADKAAVDKLLNDYIQHKLQLKIEGKPVTMHYLGYEQQLESIWTYLEIKEVPTMHKVTVNCSLLYDYQNRQSNIFHIKEQGKEQSFKLDYPETVISY